MDADRCREKTVSRKGKTIDLWYSGKTHDFGGNIQALFYPSGIPLWVSDVLPGNVHDLAAARENVLGVLRPFLDAMPVLADPGLRRRRSRRPRPGAEARRGQRARHRYPGPERADPLGALPGRARLRAADPAVENAPDVTASPGRIGLIARAAFVLVLFEHKPRVPWGRRDGVKIPGAAGLRLAGVPGGLAGVSALIGRGRRWKMRWCGRPLTSNHHGGPDPGHKPDAGSCPEGCELALRARGPDFRLPSAPAGGRDRLPHPHDGRP